MIVYVYPADTHACGHVRMIWPAQALRAAGHDVRVILPSAREGIGGDIDTRTGKLVNARVPEDADVVVMQRVSMSHLAAAIPIMRRAGIAVVVDMDDDLTKIDPANPAFWALRSDTGHKLHNRENAMQACLAATLVTVSTPALLKVYAPHGRGIVIENRVPAAYLDIEHTDSATMGWPGAVHSHPGDLQVMGPAVARLVREGYGYRGVGESYAYQPGDGGLRKALGLDEDPPMSGSVGLEQWPYELAQLGIGLAPLADTAFNAAKSWLKPLDLMACGVPWVATPSAEYERLQRLTGVGLLAKKPSQWYRWVKLLADDPETRAQESAAGRQAIRDHDLTFESSAWRWLDVWSAALKDQRGAAVHV